jgi:hypothetical protein
MDARIAPEEDRTGEPHGGHGHRIEGPWGPVRYRALVELSDAEREIVEEALERYVAVASRRPGPWALGGRAEDLSLGALQLRFESTQPWNEAGLNRFTRRGTDPRIGSGGSR